MYIPAKKRKKRVFFLNGRHNNNRIAQANTATTPTSTTQIESYVPVTCAPSTTAAATKAGTSTHFATPPCLSSSPVDIGCFFFAAPRRISFVAIYFLDRGCVVALVGRWRRFFTMWGAQQSEEERRTKKNTDDIRTTTSWHKLPTAKRFRDAKTIISFSFFFFSAPCAPLCQ